MEKISVVIITKNEEEMLPACLERLAWADEILVVDSLSNDGTVAIAEAAGAKVLSHPFEDFASQMNWSVARAAHDWILLVDADEMIPPELRDAIRGVLADPAPEYDVYNIVRDAFFMGRRMKSSTWSGERVPRLFRKGHLHYEGAVHSRTVTASPARGMLPGVMLHYSCRRIDRYFAKMELYSSLWGREMSEKGRKFSWARTFASVWWRFVHNYFLRGEIRDGVHGFISAGLGATYTFVKYVKLWGYNREREGPDGGGA